MLRYTSLVAAGSRRRRVIALSFDDGPGPYTEEIVRTLVRLHVPATFFIVGQQLRYFAAGLRDSSPTTSARRSHPEPCLAHAPEPARPANFPAACGSVCRSRGFSPTIPPFC